MEGDQIYILRIHSLPTLGEKQSFAKPLLNQALSFQNSLRRAKRSKSKLDLLLTERSSFCMHQTQIAIPKKEATL